MNVNSFRITDASGDEIGIGFDPLLGMANHSCVPNASLEFDGRCAVLTALTHIEEGEEITISYIGQSSLPHLPTSLTQTIFPPFAKPKLTTTKTQPSPVPPDRPSSKSTTTSPAPAPPAPLLPPHTELSSPLVESNTKRWKTLLP